MQKCISTSAGPSFFTILGDKYGHPSLPSEITANDFETISDYLKSQNRSREVSELLGIWYILNTNVDPPVYSLRPVSNYVLIIYSNI